MSIWDAAGAAIDAAFAEPVIYAGGGLAQPTAIPVIWSDSAGRPFQGPGNTLREIGCEIRFSDLQRRPAKSDTLVRAGTIWRPLNVTDRDDVGKWVVVLERVGSAA